MDDTFETVLLPATVAGKRRAEKPGKAPKAVKAPKAPKTAKAPKPVKAAPVAARTAHEPKPAKAEKAQPGGRRASKHTASRGPLFKLLPSPPVLLGVAALAISAGGAITAANGGISDQPTRFSQASALSGASDVSRVSLLDRQTVSRDSARDALGDSSDAELVAEAEDQLKERNAALLALAKKTQAQSDKLALNQWVIPLSGYHLTARFGEYGLWSSYHTGLDFAADPGTPIHSVANGVVTSAGYDGAYGNKTVVTLDDGTELWFCHQTSIYVSPGDEVRAGDLIGTVGSTGHVTGPHLHLEVRPGAGDPVDPYEALVVHGVTP
ncbi:M23 family metallopeptidase [Nocardioides sp. SR21]|uniref:M23 family metallopeptidase n=1 Tax=Nocardioides sp. SR21 TaxID=2919501 RepID=UPI001FA9D2ED|nr:M23 family metallopeptidase [Nocardioides sp. SR21]